MRLVSPVISPPVSDPQTATPEVSGNPGPQTSSRTRWFPDGKTDRAALTHVGYARVSTIDQDPALQLDALAAAGCGKVFEDHASGAKADRVGLLSALDHVRDGDVLIVWKLDRLGRSLPHLIETVTMLEKRGVGFRSITEAIDTTTPGGRLVFHLFGALGQFGPWRRSGPDPHTLLHQERCRPGGTRTLNT